jgi:class 3 adenylate cyclase/tetratricopeptide (TPR) repeat protein
MKCPRCQHENPPQAKFCLECGARVALTCTKCRRELPAGAKFCLECGAPVASQTTAEPRFTSPESYTPKHLAEKILTSKSALEGERKQVTVLFADLKGSMELLADRDPEEARKLLDPVLERMMAAVHHYEGTVNQVMGDGIMALFGAPLAHEDHAVRGCYAALRMQESVKRYAEEIRRATGIPPSIRVGLNSGEVVVRAIGSDLHMDYTAVGQTTHLAARMEQAALPGTIVITPHTLRLAEGYVEVKSLGPLSVKGLSEAIEAFEVTTVGAARTRFQVAAARGLTRFVGRDPEVEQLRKALEQSRRGHGQVVAVVGEPGVGKSRLFHEFTHSHRTHGWLILESGSVSYGHATAYLPVIDLLRAYFKIHGGDDHREIREKVTGKVLTLDRELEPILPAVLALLNVPIENATWQALEPAQRRERTLDAVKRLLIRESQGQPLLLVFEDLHWIDTETQAVLDGLIEGLPSARVLLLVNYRPEYQHDWGGKAQCTQLRIDPLQSESAAEFLQSLLGDHESLRPLESLLIKRTEGNPFFLEESVRTLAETLVLVGERGAYRMVRGVETVKVAPTVQAVLAARIDRLSSEQKRLLQAASAVGKDVSFALLEAIAEVPGDALHRALAQLQATQFLCESRLFPDLEYTFRHALTHEVTYGGLLSDRRRQLHAAIVEAMEHRHAGRLSEHAERLAEHAVRGELWQKAVRHLWRAGQNARARSAYRQAVVFLEQAVETLTRLPQTAETAVLHIDLVCRDLWDPLMGLTHYPRLLEHLREAARLAEQIDDRPRLASVLARTLLPLRATGQLDHAVAMGDRALALANAVGDFQLIALSGVELSAVHLRRGDLLRAEALLTRAQVALDSQPAGDGGSESAWLRRVIQQNLVLVLTETGRFREAVRRGEETLRMAEDLGHAGPMAWALACLGHAYRCRGDVDKAIDLCARGLALAREREVQNMIQFASASLGAAYMLAGRTEEAVACLEEAVEFGRSTNTLNPATLVSLGQACLSAGRSEDAAQWAHQALEVCRQRRVRNFEAGALHLIGDTAARQKPPALEEARQHYRDALALASELGMRPLVAHCHLGLGKLYRRTGKREEAREHLTTATSMYREMDMRFWLKQAEAELQAHS